MLKAVRCILCLLQSSAASLIPGKCSYPCAAEQRGCEHEEGRKKPPGAQWPWLSCLLPGQLLSSLCWGRAGHWARVTAYVTHICCGQLAPSTWGQHAQDELQLHCLSEHKFILHHFTFNLVSPVSLWPSATISWSHCSCKEENLLCKAKKIKNEQSGCPWKGVKIPPVVSQTWPLNMRCAKNKAVLGKSSTELHIPRSFSHSHLRPGTPVRPEAFPETSGHFEMKQTSSLSRYVSVTLAFLIIQNGKTTYFKKKKAGNYLLGFLQKKSEYVHSIKGHDTTGFMHNLSFPLWRIQVFGHLDFICT